MKKLWFLTMVSALALGLSACGGSKKDNDNDDENLPEQHQQQNRPDAGGGNGGGGNGGGNDTPQIGAYDTVMAQIFLYDYEDASCFMGIYADQRMDNEDNPVAYPVRYLQIFYCSDQKISPTTVNFTNNADDENYVLIDIYQNENDYDAEVGSEYLSAGGSMQLTAVSDNAVRGSLSNVTFKNYECGFDGCNYLNNDIMVTITSADISTTNVMHIDCTDEDTLEQEEFYCTCYPEDCLWGDDDDWDDDEG